MNALNAETVAHNASGAADFDTIFTAHYEPTARAIARVVNDRGRAEELAVEAFCRLLKNPKAQGAQVGGWLHRTAIRLALDELRRRARKQKYERMLGWFGSTAKSPEEQLASEQEQARVRAVLTILPVRQAELLLLRHDGASYDELASSLHLNPASVGTLLSRAQQAFRKEYIKRYGEA